ncbi:NUDIX domain-containing protein [Telmatospirillum sp.]|uniref:nucleotide triphosphate diphosphatase NUDT15 n=1 Tax=Telmatospirillum sp. TaxID=2079197 RepID=UPI00284BC468|nr:NUDIX domain-containing protein [Telmatospirillum sp.]MDR3439628.1 NUDIX domain-containing protein [Telmatospirillum sp.]
MVQEASLPWPRVGVGAVVATPDGYVLLQRAGKHGGGLWSLPGGALEPGESLIACAVRETLEEAGVVLRDARLLPFVSEDIFPQQHWVTHYVCGETSDRPRIMEPDKASGLFVGWPDEFPPALFAGLPQLIAQGYLRANSSVP